MLGEVHDKLREVYLAKGYDDVPDEQPEEEFQDDEPEEKVEVGHLSKDATDGGIVLPGQETTGEMTEAEKQAEIDIARDIG